MRAINDAGDIAANGIINGQTHAFLLTAQKQNAAVPEPDAVVFFSLGLIMLRFKRRKHKLFGSSKTSEVRSGVRPVSSGRTPPTSALRLRHPILELRRSPPHPAIPYRQIFDAHVFAEELRLVVCPGDERRVPAECRPPPATE